MQRKTSDKKQYPFMIISLTKLDTEGTHLKIIKAICDKPTVNIILSGEKLKVFLLTSGMRQGFSLSSLSFIMVEDKPWLISKAKKKCVGGGIQIGRKEVKLPLYADDMILHIENALALPFFETGMKN